MNSDACKLRKLHHLLASVAAVGLANVAHAQTAPEQPQTSAEGATTADIIVTATRRSERLQDVPMNVTAITSEALTKNNVTRFEEVAKLSPGLDLSTNSNGPAASLRGVSTVTVSGGPPAVDVYFNESSLNGLIAFRSIYDIGQVEVLRGPQGTLRGNTAPTGAITIATRRPDLNEFGGTFNVIDSKRDRWGYSGQAAVNIPVVPDILAVRLAGFYDRNDAGGTYNPVTAAKSQLTTKSLRGTVLFKPTDNFEILGMYQYLRDNSDLLARVEGTGYVPTGPGDPKPANYNGPAIAVGTNRAVQEQTERNHFTAHIASLIAKLDLGGATLNYIGGYRKQAGIVSTGGLERDPGNAILNFGRMPVGFANTGPIIQWTHELRLDSAGQNRFWDYTIGAYKESGGTDVLSSIPQIVLPGATGIPASAPPTGPLDYRYVSNLALHLYGGDQSIFGSGGNKSIFASSTFNFASGTHLRLGARHIWYGADNNFVLGLTPANIAAAVPFPTFLCPVFVPGSTASTVYPTACDIPFPGGTLIDQHSKRKFQAWIYDINVRQEITKDFMVYASYGRNWRAPGLSQGNVPAQYFLSNPEISKNYEVGLKAALLDRRVQLTVAAFQQDFKNYSATVSQVPFRDPSSATGVTDAFSITYNGNARVRGIEAAINAQLTDHWFAGVGASYTKSNFKDAAVPCRDSDFNGVPDNLTPTAAGFDAAGIVIATCSSNGAINGLPKWNLNAQSEYTVPVGEGREIYARKLYCAQGAVRQGRPTGEPTRSLEH